MQGSRNGNTTNVLNRDDDSLAAAQLDIDDARERITKLEENINNPDKLAVLIADAAAKSSVLRDALSTTVLSVMNDHDTREKLQKIVRKLDRERLVQVIKYAGTFAIGGATVAGAIFGFMALN